ncbi:MAG: hypothetical protein ABWX70_14565, partial [Hyphomicrobium sp.]
MTFFEEACHRHAVALWRRRPDVDAWNRWRARAFYQILSYFELSGQRPTPSGSMVLLARLAAACAARYCGKAETLP